MIDINTFLTILLCVLGSILLVILIILGVKMIYVLDRLNGMIDDINIKISKFDKMFHLVDLVTDQMAMISDKMVDCLSNLIRKIFNRKEKRKEEDTNE